MPRTTAVAKEGARRVRLESARGGETLAAEKGRPSSIKSDKQSDDRTGQEVTLESFDWR